MSRRKKRILGLFGLALVMIATFFAASLPTPEAEATSSVTDKLVVRVAGSVPEVKITGISNEGIYTNMSRKFVVSYENIENLVITLVHTDLDGNTVTDVLDEEQPEGSVGDEEYYINLVEM